MTPHEMTDEPTGRAVPFHCPYCGEENLFPREDGWECRGCLRAFSVTYLGQLPRPAIASQGGGS